MRPRNYKAQLTVMRFCISCPSAKDFGEVKNRSQYRTGFGVQRFPKEWGSVLRLVALWGCLLNEVVPTDMTAFRRLAQHLGA